MKIRTIMAAAATGIFLTAAGSSLAWGADWTCPRGYADCTDYENLRSGRFVPSMMGTLFSFVDKMISSFSSLIQGIALAAAGVGSVIITPNEPVAGSFNTSIIICFCIVPIIGHIATVIAMHFYKLDHKKMEEVQQQLAERKAMNAKEA